MRVAPSELDKQSRSGLWYLAPGFWCVIQLESRRPAKIRAAIAAALYQQLDLPMRVLESLASVVIVITVMIAIVVPPGLKLSFLAQVAIPGEYLPLVCLAGFQSR